MSFDKTRIPLPDKICKKNFIFYMLPQAQTERKQIWKLLLLSKRLKQRNNKLSKKEILPETQKAVFLLITNLGVFLILLI